MDPTMSLALWVSAFAAVASFLAVIGVKPVAGMIVRGKSAVGRHGDKKNDTGEGRTVGNFGIEHIGKEDEAIDEAITSGIRVHRNRIDDEGMPLQRTGGTDSARADPVWKGAKTGESAKKGVMGGIAPRRTVAGAANGRSDGDTTEKPDAVVANAVPDAKDARITGKSTAIPGSGNLDAKEGKPKEEKPREEKPWTMGYAAAAPKAGGELFMTGTIGKSPTVPPVADGKNAGATGKSTAMLGSGNLDAREGKPKKEKPKEEKPRTTGHAIAAPKAGGGVVSMILSGIVESRFDDARSADSKEEGRMHVNRWDDAFSRGKWDWTPLMKALECYIHAVGYAPRDQYSWVNLAFVYHLIGDRDRALQCLEKSGDLARLGPGGFGRDYQQVERAIKNNTTLFGERLPRPRIPASFQDEHEKFLARIAQGEGCPSVADGQPVRLS